MVTRSGGLDSASLKVQGMHLSPDGSIELSSIFYLQTIDFELQTTNIAYFYVEDLLARLHEAFDFAQGVHLETCCNILDLLYENSQYRGCEDDSDFAAAAVLVRHSCHERIQSSDFQIAIGCFQSSANNG